MAKSAADVIQIMRNVTGRVDPADPLFTDEIMLQYLSDFLTLDSTADIRIFKNRTWWEFQFGPNDDNPYPVDLQQLGFSTIEPPAYADGFQLFWYQSPQEFYQIWPETQEYQPTRPTYVLYYDNKLTFRNPPDKEYTIKIAAYRDEVLVDSDSQLAADYLYRYAAYGASLNIFSDFGENDKWQQTYPIFQRYRNLVYARTYQQQQNQRPAPEF